MRLFPGPAKESCSFPCQSLRWSLRNCSRGKILRSLVVLMEVWLCFLMWSFCGFSEWSFLGCVWNSCLYFYLMLQNLRSSLFHRLFPAVFGWLIWPIDASLYFLSFLITPLELIAFKGFFPCLCLENCSIFWLTSSYWSWILYLCSASLKAKFGTHSCFPFLLLLVLSLLCHSSSC